MRPPAGTPAAARASSPASWLHTTPSKAARAIWARVVEVRSPDTTPVASGRLGVRSPSKCGTTTTPPAPAGTPPAMVSRMCRSTRSRAAAQSVTRVQLSVQTRGRKRPVASAKPATRPVPSAVGASATANTVPLVPRETATSPGPSPRARAAAMLSPVPQATTAPGATSRAWPAGSTGPRTRGRAPASSRPGSTSASRSGRSRPSAGDHQPVPEASPRSVTAWSGRPVSHHVSQSWGSSTRASRDHAPGRLARSQASLVMVKEAVGTEPHAAAHPSGPRAATSSAAWGADSTSFQSLAGWTGWPAASRATSPCCWPATERAATRCEPAASQACQRASHHAWGSCSLRGGATAGWGAVPVASTVPSSASQTTTLHDWVEESTPATITGPTGPQRTPSRCSTVSWSSRSWP
jgi:hypothetical protein